MTFILSKSSVYSNQSVNGPGGGLSNSGSSFVDIDSSTLSGNQSFNWGGGIYITGSSAAVTVTHGTLYENSASQGDQVYLKSGGTKWLIQ